MSKARQEKRIDGPCEHLKDLAEGDFPPARTPDVCEDCLKEGTQWVHLRECMTCGHVGCCDSSPRRHATRHFHETQHPVVRSVEPGEHWTWCYVHEVMGELAPKPVGSGTKPQVGH
jgi:CPA1 family monovalent cation:H+ antiporter